MIDWNRLRERLDGDGEFHQAARHWDATLRLDVGSTSHRIRIRDGQVDEVAACPGDATCDVFVSAPTDVWDHMLQPEPRPHYHDLMAAATHHGLEINAEFLDYAAYYPALRRLVEVLREGRV